MTSASLDEPLRERARQIVLETLALAPSSFAAMYGTSCRALGERVRLADMWSLVEELAIARQIELVIGQDRHLWHASRPQLEHAAHAYRRWLGELPVAELTVDALSVDPVGLWLRSIGSAEPLNAFDAAVLDAILAGDDPVRVALRAQLRGLVVTAREVTGVGFFAELAVAPDAVAAAESTMRFGDVIAKLPGVAHGAGFVVLVANGFLTMLEGYTFDEPWPADAELLGLEIIRRA